MFSSLLNSLTSKDSKDRQPQSSNLDSVPRVNTASDGAQLPRMAENNHAARLMGDYGTPSTARSIPTVINSGAQRSKPKPKNYGGVKPTNTLNAARGPLLQMPTFSSASYAAPMRPTEFSKKRKFPHDEVRPFEMHNALPKPRPHSAHSVSFVVDLSDGESAASPPKRRSSAAQSNGVQQVTISVPVDATREDEPAQSCPKHPPGNASFSGITDSLGLFSAETTHRAAKASKSPAQPPRRAIKQTCPDSDIERAAKGQKSQTSRNKIIARMQPRPDGGGDNDSSDELTRSSIAFKRNVPPRKLSESQGITSRHFRKFCDAIDLSHDEDSVTIAAFHATSCILDGANIALHWDDKNDALVLHNGSSPVSIQDETQVVKIGSVEANEVHYSPTVSKIHIKGSMTNVSNGSICLALAEGDKSGQEWLLTKLAQVNKNIKTIKISAERVEAQYNRQVQQLKLEMERIRTLPKALQMPTPVDDIEDNVSERQRSTGFLRRVRRNRQDTADEPFPELFLRRSMRDRKPTLRRQQEPSPEKWTRVNPLDRWPRPVVYPAEGPRRVTVDFDDLPRLDEGEFLNDSIVGFGLRQIEESLAPEVREKIHFFSSFFYSSLSSKGGRNTPNYDAVKRWTKNVDIFKTPYIVVPICVRLHWFVAIICNLDTLMEGGEKCEEEATEEKPVEVEKNDEEKSQEEESDKTTEERIKIGSSAEEDETVDDDILNSDGSKLTKSKVAKPVKRGKRRKQKSITSYRTYNAKTPLIITLDSLGGDHCSEVRLLKEYVAKEGEEKRGMQIDRSVFQGMRALGIPEQTNFCDCGVYLIGYVEQFVKDPQRFVAQVAGRRLEGHVDFADFSPSEKRADLRNTLLKLQSEQQEVKEGQEDGDDVDDPSLIMQD